MPHSFYEQRFFIKDSRLRKISSPDWSHPASGNELPRQPCRAKSLCSHFTHAKFLQPASHGGRKVPDEPDVTGNLEVGNLPLAEALEFILGGSLPRAQLNPDHHFLAI
jgi:hypothetical protein